MLFAVKKVLADFRENTNFVTKLLELIRRAFKALIKCFLNALDKESKNLNKMITIINQSENSFSIDEIFYSKIYQALPQGAEDISIVSVYDASQILLNSTKFDEITVDGNSFASQALLIEAIIDVLYISNHDNGFIVRNIENLDNLIAANTTGRYVIVNNLVLDDTKTLPSGVTLELRNSLITFGINNIVGNLTKIIAGNDKVFDYDSTGRLTGTWNAKPVHYWFGSYADGITYDSSYLEFYDEFCKLTGNEFDGLGKTFAVTTFKLTCGTYKSAKFIPEVNNTGSGVTFQVNENTGVCKHENISCKGFLGYGASISRASYDGVATFVTRGNCEYSENGDRQRATITSEVDMNSDFVIPVSNESGFVAGDLVWIGDGKYAIESITTSQITLDNNGSQAKLHKGSRNVFASGQYITRDGNGKNGITIGDGRDGWNLDIAENSIVCSDNGWFGLFHWANNRKGIQRIHSILAERNGFIGIGLGVTNIGFAKDCITRYNGNNGIDTLSSTEKIKIFGGVSNFNGVEGVYLGGSQSGAIGRLHDYDCKSNKRMGFLLHNNKVACPYSVLNVDARSNDYRSFTITGCGVGTVSKCKVGLATYGHSVFIEGKDGCKGLQNHTLEGNEFFENLGGNYDISGNLDDYVTSDAGVIKLINNYRDDAEVPLSTNIYNINRDLCILKPSSNPIITVSSESVSAGAQIVLTVVTKRSYDSGVKELGMIIAKMSTFTSAQMITQASFDTVNRTAGIEIYAGTSKWITATNFGTFTYSLVLSSAGSRYLLVDVEGIKKGFLLTWT